MYYILKGFFLEKSLLKWPVYLFIQMKQTVKLCMNIANTVDRKDHSGMTHTDF